MVIYERRCVVDAIRGCRLVASAVDEKKIGQGRQRLLGFRKDNDVRN